MEVFELQKPMRAVLLVFCLLFMSGLSTAQNMSINATGAAPDSSAMLDIQSTTRGLLVPRMTVAQRNAIASPAQGLLIFQTDATKGLWLYDTTTANWSLILTQQGLADLDSVLSVGNNAGGDSILNLGAIGIGTSIPTMAIHVQDSVNGEMGAMIENEDSDGYAILRLRADNANDFVFFYNGSTRAAGGGPDRATVRNDGGDLHLSSLSDDVFITAGSGNVGIGNSAPTQNLDVTGTAEIDSLRINNAYGLPTTDGTNTQVLATDGAGNVSWVAPTAGATPWTDGGGTIYTTTDEVGIGTASPHPNYRLSIETNGGGNGNGALNILNGINGNSRKLGIYSHIDDGGNNAKFGHLSLVEGKSSGNDTLASFYSIIDNNNAADTAYGLYSEYVDATGINYGVRTRGEDFNSLSGNLGIGVTNPLSQIQIGDLMAIDGTSGVHYYGYNIYFDGSDYRHFENGIASATAAGSDFIGMYKWPAGTAGGIVDNDANMIFQMKDSLFTFEGIQSDTLVRVKGGLMAERLAIENEYWLPPSDGTSNQILKTDGAGNVTWQADNGTAEDSTRITDADENTTVYIDGSDNTIFENNGTEWMRLASNGDLGVGTSSMVGNAKFTLSENVNAYTGMYIRSGATGLPFYGYSLNGAISAWTYIDGSDSGKWKINNGGNDRLTINTAGDVGIGETTPTYLLHVSTNANNDGIRIESGLGNNSFLQFYEGSSTEMGFIQFAGSTNDMLLGTTASGNDLFLRSNGSTRMTIESDGDVGIGTTSPLSDLHVNSTTTQSVIRLTNSATSSNGLWLLSNNTGSVLANYENTSLKFGTNGADRVTITAAGDVGIGITAPSHILHINGVGRSTSTLWAVTSDERAKQNIETITNATDLLMQFRPVTYEWKPTYKAKYGDTKEFRYGFISQEAEKVIPEMVSEIVEIVGNDTIEDFKVLDQEPLIPLLVRAIQEQQVRIDQLTEENVDKQEEIDKMNAMLEEFMRIQGIDPKSVEKAIKSTAETK